MYIKNISGTSIIIHTCVFVALLLIGAYKQYQDELLSFETVIILPTAVGKSPQLLEYKHDKLTIYTVSPLSKKTAMISQIEVYIKSSLQTRHQIPSWLAGILGKCGRHCDDVSTINFDNLIHTARAALTLLHAGKLSTEEDGGGYDLSYEPNEFYSGVLSNLFKVEPVLNTSFSNSGVLQLDDGIPMLAMNVLDNENSQYLQV